MIPFSFDSLTRSAHLELPHRTDAADVAKAVQDSFELHLRQTPPAREAESSSPSGVEREEPETVEERDSAASDASSDEPVRGDTGDAPSSESATSEDDRRSEQEQSDEASEEAEQTADEHVVVAVAQNVEKATDGVVQVAIEEAIADEATAVDGQDSQQDDAASQRAAETVDEVDAVDEVDSTTEATDADTEETQQTQVRERNQLQAADRNTADLSVEGQPQVSADDTEATDDAPGADAAKESGEPSRQARESRAIFETTDQDSQPADVAPRTTEDELSAEVGDEESTWARRRTESSNAETPRTHRVAGEGVATDAPSRFAQTLSARGTERADRGLQITSADQRRFVDRIAKAVHTAEGRGGTLRLRLSPPELGSLRLEVKLLNGVMSAKVEAETPLARSLLLDSLPVLRERLEEQGVRVEQFDVDLLDRQNTKTPDGLEQQRRQREDGAEESDAHSSTEEAAEKLPESQSHFPTGDGQLNVMI